MRSETILKVIVVLSLMALTTPVFAVDYSGGATIVPVSENLPQFNFNLNTDAASIYLEKAILYKNNGWFTSDKDVAILAKMTINSQKRDRMSSSLTISRIYKFDVSLYDSGRRIEIPLKSLPLLDTFKLKVEDYVVTSIVLDIFLSKKKEKTPFSKTLETLINISKKIPVPGNPYAQYATVFGDAFSEILDEAVKEGADTVPFARFGLRFLQGAHVTNYTEKTGVYAIIIGSDSTEDGVLKIDQLTGKNLSFDDVAGLRCDSKKVKNNHLIVRVTSSTDPFDAMLAREETIERLRSEAKPAVHFAENKGAATSTLTQHFVGEAALKTIAIDEKDIEKAIKELNAVKALNVLTAK